MTRKIAIFGGPGGGAIVAQSVIALGDSVQLLGFLNDVIQPGERILGVPVLGPFASWRDLDPDVMFMAHLHKVDAMEARRQIVHELGVPKERWTTVIDPQSAVAADAGLAGGSFVGPFATIGPGARLGEHTAVRSGAHVSHDCVVGSFVFLGINATVSGFCEIGDCAYLGPGAIVSDHCRIGRGAIVRLGSVVTKDVPDFTVVAGSPARRVPGQGGGRRPEC